MNGLKFGLEEDFSPGTSVIRLCDGNFTTHLIAKQNVDQQPILVAGRNILRLLQAAKLLHCPGATNGQECCLGKIRSSETAL